jgi:hypothetical protein
MQPKHHMLTLERAELEKMTDNYVRQGQKTAGHRFPQNGQDHWLWKGQRAQATDVYETLPEPSPQPHKKLNN